jgi:hypothetical protein
MARINADAMSRIAMFHVAGSATQLRSYDDDGPTLYAITVVGDRATIAGPALDASGLAAWPRAVAAAARGALAEGASAAGAVLVYVTVRAGRDSHCMRVTVPYDAPRRERRRAGLA